MFIISGFFTILLSVSGLSYAEEPSNVLAKVNGVPITLNEVEEEINRIIPQTLFHRSISPEKREGFKKDALERLIERDLEYQEAKRQRIKADRGEVKEIIEEMKKRFSSEKEFKEALKKNKLTLKDYEARIEKDLIIRKIIEKEIEDKIKVGDEDLKAYYEKNINKYKELEKIRLRHIMIKFDSGTGSRFQVPGSKLEGTMNKEEARAKAEEVLKRVKAGEDFASLAYENSEDPYRVKGGDLGYIHRGRMEPEIEKIAFGLKIGEIMGPIETEYGFYIIKLEDRKPESQLSFDEAKDKIRKELESKKREERKMEWMKSLKEKAKIEYQ